MDKKCPWGLSEDVKKCHQAAMIGEASNRNKKILSVFVNKNKFCTKKLKFRKNGHKVPLGIGIVKLYNKLHQAAMIARPSNRNQKI